MVVTIQTLMTGCSEDIVIATYEEGLLMRLASQSILSSIDQLRL